jgi:Arc/MetJ-type ribon-helix-helix transcriptional regulator
MTLKIVTIYIPEKYLDCIKIMVDFGYFPSRSEAIRQSLRLFLSKESEFIKDIEPEVFGNLKEIQMDVLCGNK